VICLIIFALAKDCVLYSRCDLWSCNSRSDICLILDFKVDDKFKVDNKYMLPMMTNFLRETSDFVSKKQTYWLILHLYCK